MSGFADLDVHCPYGPQLMLLVSMLVVLVGRGISAWQVSDQWDL